MFSSPGEGQTQADSRRFGYCAAMRTERFRQETEYCITSMRAVVSMEMSVFPSQASGNPRKFIRMVYTWYIPNI
jgi:hypothetical protein